jgi:hypothetical protein
MNLKVLASNLCTGVCEISQSPHTPLAMPLTIKNVVAYRHDATQWLYKQRPLLSNAHIIHARNNRKAKLCNSFLSNGSVNRFPRQRTPKQQHKTGVFYGPCRDVISRTVWRNELVRGGQDERRERESVCVCVCVCEREREFVCVWERERPVWRRGRIPPPWPPCES